MRTVRYLAALLGLLLVAVSLAACTSGGKTYEVVIPEGEWARKTGNVLAGVPQRAGEGGGIVLTLSKGDTLVVVNNDTVEHTIGLVTVRPGERVSHVFQQAGEFEGACTLLEGERVTIAVT